MKTSWLPRVILFVCAATVAFGQQSTGTIVGTVTDPGGAIIPGANATITSVTTNGQRTVSSDQNGTIRFEALVNGTYKLDVSKQGFKTLSIGGIELLSSETRDMGKLVLQIGAVNESIEVTAESTPVQTASSERADSVTTAQLENITMKGRDPYGELHLLPGVIEVASSRDLSAYSEMGTISINGLSGGSISPAVDGATVQQMAGTSLVFVTPNMDAIGEVRVLSNGYQAEYGRDAGATINFVTKSGTSQFHGTFHWDHRNEGLNANSFFNNRTSVARPIYRYLILGGSLGGPLYIPKVMPHFLKGKMFFFYSPEYSTSKQPTNTVTVNEPTALEKQGNFSQTFVPTSSTALTTPKLLPIIDANTGVAFPGNIIPASRINPVGLAMLNLMLPPNGYVNPSSPYSANASYSATPGFKKLDNVLRIDSNVSKNVTAYFRMVRDFQDQGFANSITGGLGAYTQSTPGGTYLAHVAWVIKPTLVNETQIVYGWTTQGVPAHDSPADSTLYRSSALDPPRLVPLPGTSATVPWGYIQYPPFLPQMQYTGGTYLGYSSWNPNSSSGAFYKNGDHQYIWRDDLTWTHGTHTAKAGIYWEHSSDFDEGGPGGNFAGTYNFGSNSSNPLDTGDGYANALLGIVTQYTEASTRAYQQRYYVATEWYVQDNWKVTNRLTLDYGVRMMHNGSTQDQSHYSAQFLPSAYSAANRPVLFTPNCAVAPATPGGACSAANQQAINPLNGQVYPSSAIAQVVPGTNVIDGIQWPVVHGLSYAAVQFMPRFGFAWNVNGDGKMVIRGSMSVASQRPSLNNSMIGQYTAPVTFNNTVNNTPLTAISGQAGQSILSPVTGVVNNTVPLETVHNWNLTFERSIGFGTVINLAYVGTYDRHALQALTVNNIPFGSYALTKNIFNNAEINANLLRSDFPGLSTVSYECGCISTLNYNALQTSVKHRFTRGLTFSGNYQFSKGLGTSGWDPYHIGQAIPLAYGGTITLPGQRQWYYGPTATDRSQYAGASFAYQLPALSSHGALVKYLAGGWTLSGVTSFSTGAAVSPSCSTTAAYPANDPSWTGLITGATGVRCQVVGDWKSFTHDFYNNFNTAAFAYPTGGTQANPQPNFGNTGLGIMRQPAWWNQDLTIAKAFSLGEKGRSLVMNFQTYNVFNHTEFNTIGTTYSFNASGQNTNTTTGQYTAAQPNRQVVISAKFQF